MSNLVILVGATGYLGSRIMERLKREAATVRCLVRAQPQPAILKNLKEQADEVVEVNFSDIGAIANACQEGSVVVSAIAGLKDVIVDLQGRILQGAIKARVPRFIPSDFSINYLPIPQGENRNLNLREDFRRILDASPIQATSIMCGGFMDMLTGVAPFILFPLKRVLCWGDPSQLMDFTLINDVATYTAKAALDPNAPRYLNIAGDVLNAKDLAQIMTDLTGKKHKVFRPGGLRMFHRLINFTKLTTPDKGQLYPAWQGMQYMYSMSKGDCKLERLDNDRYKMQWTTAKELLDDFLHNESHVRYVP